MLMWTERVTDAHQSRLRWKTNSNHVTVCSTMCIGLKIGIDSHKNSFKINSKIYSNILKKIYSKREYSNKIVT